MGRIKRIDGRTEGTLRHLSCELSCLHRADGSALWKTGSTHVLASVHGPIAPLNMNKEASSSIVSVLVKSSNNKGVHEDKTFLTNVLSNCIDTSQHPRTVIQVVLQVIQMDGSLLSCLLHAAVAALIDAGVELLYLPVATTCLIPTTGSSKQMFLDPCAAEEEESDKSILVLVTQSNAPQKILGSHTFGSEISLDQVLACQQIAEKACPAIPAFLRLAVEQKVTRESQTLWSR